MSRGKIADNVVLLRLFTKNEERAVLSKEINAKIKWHGS